VFSYFFLFIVVLSSFNTILSMSPGLYSVSWLYYAVALLVAPITMFIVGMFSFKRRKIVQSVFFSFCAVLSLIFFRWVLVPFYPSLTVSGPASGSKLPVCDIKGNSLEVVYTWVNVTDLKWQNLSSSFGCNTKQYQSGVGDADPFLALKHSMRSLNINFPDAGKITIVTERDQVPVWLNTNHPMIQIAFHDEFMPAESAPVFNSNPTEYLLHRLVNTSFIQSNCFLYVNDDFFFNRPLTLRDFVTDDGRMVFYAVNHVPLPGDGFVDLPVGTWDLEEVDTNSWITDPHVPIIIHAEASQRMLDQCGATCNVTSRCTREGPMPMNAYQEYLALQHAYLLEFVTPLTGMTMRIPLGLPGISAWFNEALLNCIRPLFVYIESHNSVEEKPEFVKFIANYLKSSFPDKAPWEL
jgi:hypothetical protein